MKRLSYIEDARCLKVKRNVLVMLLHSLFLIPGILVGLIKCVQCNLLEISCRRIFVWSTAGGFGAVALNFRTGICH